MDGRRGTRRAGEGEEVEVAREHMRGEPRVLGLRAPSLMDAAPMLSSVTIAVVNEGIGC